MGITFTCPGDDAFDEGLEALIMRSISFNGDDDKAPLKSFSFSGRDAEPSILKAFGSGKLIIEGSLNIHSKEMEISIKSPASSEKENSLNLAGFKKSRFSPLCGTMQQSTFCNIDGSEHQAALKLQKFYKSFRTRRQLADCAVLVEQRWWKLLDFAMLRRSSISFFDIEKPESAVSRWSRARTKAAKVGKGLSKDDKAQKLARQHWLEAIDPRHRYGHNLYFYYDCWLQCESKQPFFYWLDVGEGKEVNLEQQCPRSKLQKQCIKYLGPNERKKYEVIVEDGKFLYKISRQFLDTSESPKGTKWIFVLSTSKALYVGQKKKGVFQHSSFLAGGATSSAGRLVVEKGILKAVWPHSGHYRPTEKNFQEFMNFLNEINVDLTDVKKCPTEDDEESGSWVRSNTFMTSNWSEEDLTKKTLSEDIENGKRKCRAPAGLTNIEIPERFDPFSGCGAMAVNFSNIPNRLAFGMCENIWERSSQIYELPSKPNKQQKVNNNMEDNEGNSDDETNNRTSIDESGDVEGIYTCMVKQNLFDDLEIQKDFVPQELIFDRINENNGFNPCQLGQNIPFRWTTGAGPRIGCVRDYPSSLQFHALEQVNLSPRGAGGSGQIKASTFSINTDIFSCKELQRDH